MQFRSASPRAWGKKDLNGKQGLFAGLFQPQ